MSFFHFLNGILQGKPDDVIAPEMVGEACCDDDGSTAGSSRRSLGDSSSDMYPISILYGSETGRAMEYAQELAREAEEYGFQAILRELDDAARTDFRKAVSIDEHEYQGIPCATIIVVSTSCEGDAPDNASEFCKMLKEKSTDSSDFLRGLDFAMFGLGDSKYENFNTVSKFIDSTLPRLGAERLLDLVCGDDDRDMDADFWNWRRALWPLLRAHYYQHGETSSSTQSASDEVEQCPYRVEYLPKSEAHLSDSVRSSKFPDDSINFSTACYFTASDCPIISKRNIRSIEDERSTVHFEIDISECNAGLKYKTGDRLAVLPVNDDEIVNRVAVALGFDLEDSFLLLPAWNTDEEDFRHIFPTPCSIKECLSRYCDLSGPPCRFALKKLSTFATSSRDWSKLTKLASSREYYQREIIDNHVGIADLICNVCPSIKLSLLNFIFICRRMQPRYYAISSSPLVYPKSVHITVSILNKLKTDGSIYKGTCTNFLNGLNVGDTCRVFREESSVFRPPSDATKPLILIGPGTGIAPIRALLQERSQLRNDKNIDIGQTVLYFGCKNRWSDYIYADELEAFRKDGTISNLHVAYSREHSEKVYVQYLLAKNAEETWDLIHNKGAYIYVSGPTKMGADVSHAFIAIFAVYGMQGPVGAIKYMKKLRKEGRFFRQLWA